MKGSRIQLLRMSLVRLYVYLSVFVFCQSYSLTSPVGCVREHSYNLTPLCGIEEVVGIYVLGLGVMCVLGVGGLDYPQHMLTHAHCHLVTVKPL